MIIHTYRNSSIFCLFNCSGEKEQKISMSKTETGKYAEPVQEILTTAFQLGAGRSILLSSREAGCQLSNILHQGCKCFARQGSRLVSQKQKQHLKSNDNFSNSSKNRLLCFYGFIMHLIYTKNHINMGIHQCQIIKRSPYKILL